MKAKEDDGVKMYGKFFLFNSRRKFADFLRQGISNCEGSERERFVKALSNLMDGKRFTDTDERMIAR
jgi:hypothetical protein